MAVHMTNQSKGTGLKNCYSDRLEGRIQGKNKENKVTGQKKPVADERRACSKKAKANA